MAKPTHADPTAQCHDRYTEDSWKAITDEQIRIVDMEMGDYLIEPEMREFLVITDSE